MRDSHWSVPASAAALLPSPAKSVELPSDGLFLECLLLPSSSMCTCSSFFSFSDLGETVCGLPTFLLGEEAELVEVDEEGRGLDFPPASPAFSFSFFSVSLTLAPASGSGVCGLEEGGEGRGEAEGDGEAVSVRGVLCPLPPSDACAPLSDTCCMSRVGTDSVDWCACLAGVTGEGACMVGDCLMISVCCLGSASEEEGGGVRRAVTGGAGGFQEESRASYFSMAGRHHESSAYLRTAGRGEYILNKGGIQQKGTETRRRKMKVRERDDMGHVERKCVNGVSNQTMKG